MDIQKEVTVEAESYDKAAAKALKLLQTTKEKVGIEVISEQKSGLLGFGKKSVVIRVTLKPNLAQLVDEILDSTGDPGSQTEILQSEIESTEVDLESKDGLVSIGDGVVSVIDPQGGGRFPIIIPGENTVVTVNEQRINEPTVISSEDRVWVDVAVYRPEQTLEVEISEDKLTAYLKIQRFNGLEFALEDSPAVHELVPRARLVRVVSPNPISREEIDTIVEMSGVVYGLDQSAIESAIGDRESTETRTIIARGKPAVNAQSGKITIKFKRGAQVNSLNPYGEGLVESIEAGAILAVKEPPVYGEDGVDIFGMAISPREATDVELQAGDGVKIIQNGAVVVAMTSGRPVVEGKENNKFSIVPVHTVHGDVNINVGNLKFKGDIIVLGSILDGFRLEAGGNIKVYGSVVHAELAAGGSIYVAKNIISSTIKTGGQSLVYKLAVPLLKETKIKVENLKEAFKQLKKHPSFSVADLKEGDGRLIQLLIDSRYQVLARMALRLKEMLAGHELIHESYKQLVETIYNKLYGLGPLRIQEINELDTLMHNVDEVLQEIIELMTAPGDIYSAYVQNSCLEASGDIVISGAGSIISDLTAGRNIIINQNHGMVRGGQLTANGLIKLRELGSSAEAMVVVHLIGKSKLEADLVHPSVVIEHGGQKYRFKTWPARYVEASANKDDTLIVNKLKDK